MNTAIAPILACTGGFPDIGFAGLPVMILLNPITLSIIGALSFIALTVPTRRSRQADQKNHSTPRQ